MAEEQQKQMVEPRAERPVVTPGRQWHSDSVGKIALALAKAQGSYKQVKLDSKVKLEWKGGGGKEHKYASLGAILDATRPALSENEIAFQQIPYFVDGSKMFIRCFLMHSSGEFIAGEYYVTGQFGNAHAVGSAMTYARRYSAGPFLGVATEEDDDGQAAVKVQQEKKQAAAQERIDQKEKEAKANADKKTKKVTASQLKRLMAVAAQTDWNEESINTAITNLWSLGSKKELTQDKYEWLVKKIQEMDPDAFATWFMEYQQKQAEKGGQNANE